MTAHLVMLLALSPPPDEASLAPRWTLRAVPWTAAEIRDECRSVVVRTLRGAEFAPDRDVPDLLLCRAAVTRTDVLGRTEQVQTQRRLDYCLEQSRLKLERKLARLTKEQSRSRADKTGSASAASLGGGAGDVQQARQLIALIEAVIQPDTWEANGGRGVIQYWSPGYALVIRNTQSVHEDVGGLIRALEASR